MTGMAAAVLVGLAGLAFTGFWFGVHRRRRAEAGLGIQALANLKWREGIALVLAALRRDGYEVAEDPSGGGTQTMLRKDGELVLLDYKHGTAYCLGAPAVNEFFSSVRMRGANRGLLMTLGTLEPGTTEAAGSSIHVTDGSALWSRLRPFVDQELLASVRGRAAAATRRGLWIGSVASLAAAGLAFAAAGGIGADAPGAAGTVETAPSPPSAQQAVTAALSSSGRSDDAVLRQLNETAAAMAEVAKLTPEQLALRRADVARRVSGLPQVVNAAWSAQRTLLLVLNRTDGKDQDLIEETCRIIVQHEEMRFTRIQLNPPEGSNQAVRWRLCE